MLPVAVALASACAMPYSDLSPVPAPADSAPEGVSPEVWTHAMAAHRMAVLTGETVSPLITVIDFSRPSNEERLWVVDVSSGEILDHDFVAHGEGSGGVFATSFSNRDGTHKSSLGTFITGSSYRGIRGLSLRLRGLEPGINDKAFSRGIVIHGTPNVSAARAKAGTMGRTEGCPAVPSTSARRIIRLIENGVVVFAWYPEKQFLERSEYLERGAAAVRLSALE